MAVAATQLSSFYSHRHLARPEPERAEAAESGPPERRVRDALSRGDSLFNRRRYSEALTAYSEAYAAIPALLHPDFPVRELAGEPARLAQLDLFEPLAAAVSQLARQQNGGRAVAPVLDLSREFLELVEQRSVSPHPPRSPAQLAYETGMAWLEQGRAALARQALEQALRLNRRNSALEVRIAAALATTLQRGTEEPTLLRVRVGPAVRTIALDAAAGTQLVEQVYRPRLSAADLDALDPRLELDTNFLAHLPHLFSFVLPLDLGDCYAALGRTEDALTFYSKSLDYEFLNAAIEAPAVWIKAARAIVKDGDRRFSRGDARGAAQRYELIVRSDGTVPAEGRLYRNRGKHLGKIAEGVRVDVAALDARQETHGPSERGALLAHVRGQQAKLGAGLDALGLVPGSTALATEEVPVWTFDYLQSTARYFAQHAIQAWREFISFQSAAEQGEATERELQQAQTMSQMAVDVQKAQLQAATDHAAVVEELLTAATLHKERMNQAKTDYENFGDQIVLLERLQAEASLPKDTNGWSGSVDNWIEHGRHREKLSNLIQINEFDRQIAQAQEQITVAEKQKTAAAAQEKVATLQRDAALQQLEFAEASFEAYGDRLFTADLWSALADRLGEVAQSCLDAGIKVALLMERAYAVENDRELHRIRKEYAGPGAAGLLTGGDALLMDIDAFTLDLVTQVRSRRNRIRHAISLGDLEPLAFQKFARTGVMDFTVPLWLLERAYPGSYLHRIQNVEIEIEGLQSPEGFTGTLTHLGFSKWRRKNGKVGFRATAPETLILSGFRLRRDLALFRTDPGRLGLFENCGTEGSWRLELPLETNDVDFTTISDVRLVLYFDCLHDAALEAKTRADFPAKGEAQRSLSARLHAADALFAFGPPPDGADAIRFALPADSFPFNHRDPRLTDLAVQVLRRSDAGKAEPFPGIQLAVRMGGKSGEGTAGANGVLATQNGSGALAPLAGMPVGDVEVQFTGPSADRGLVADVLLLLTYGFDYRR